MNDYKTKERLLLALYHLMPEDFILMGLEKKPDKNGMIHFTLEDLERMEDYINEKKYGPSGGAE